MRLDRLHLRHFRSYDQAEVEFSPGLTALVGANGQGKTNVLEAIAYLAGFRSFRASSTEVMVREGEVSAQLRAEGVRWESVQAGDEGRQVLIEAEINRTGRNRVQLNRQVLQRPGQAVGVLQVTLFTPDDLATVKDGPQRRRDLLDDLALALEPRIETTLSTLERVLRQRNALLRQSGGRLDASAALTLEVWDAKLTPVAELLMAKRAELVQELGPQVRCAYQQLCGEQVEAEVTYRPSAAPGQMAEALARARVEDLRRGSTTVGPHRDELDLTLRGMPVRSHGSQGEQRSFALALKLAGHRLVTNRVGHPPLLLLDDVFSELDPRRCDALIAHLPAGQTVLTSADRLPRTAQADIVHQVRDGRVVRQGS